MIARDIIQRVREIQFRTGRQVADVLAGEYISVEAIDRLGSPGDVQGLGMILVASGALAVNLTGMWILSRGRHENLNVRGAWLHVATQKVEQGRIDTVCVLMPARTDTSYWQDYVIREVRRTSPWNNAPRTTWDVDARPALHTVVNLPGRLTFIGADAPYTQPCCAVIYSYNVKDKEHPTS